MRIVIDLQAMQTESRFKSIGIYTSTQVKNLVSNRGENEIFLVLNGMIPETIGHIRASYRGILPQENILVWNALGPVKESEQGNDWRRQTAEKIREALIYKLQPDIIFIPSIFEGYLDEGVTSINSFSSKIKTVVAIDKLEISDHGSEMPYFKNYTSRKFELLKKASSIIVLPPLTKEEVCLELPTLKDKIRTSTQNNEITNQKNISEIKYLFKIFSEIISESSSPLRITSNERPKLAYIAPLFLERSSSSEHSANLIPELSNFYEIDVVTPQTELKKSWLTSNCKVRSIKWFLNHKDQYDRILYHLDNSSLSKLTFELLNQVAGVVLLHDFFLGDALLYIEGQKILPHALSKALYHSHGYLALAERFQENGKNITQVIDKYPVNFEILQKAQGVIVYSQYSANLAKKWYGNSSMIGNLDIIPMIQKPTISGNRSSCKEKIGLKANDFLVCSLGFLGQQKFNQRIIQCWLKSTLANDPNCYLIFIGESKAEKDLAELTKTIQTSGLEKQIRITDWSDLHAYQHHLGATDIAVQLKTYAKGETVAPVMDCLNFGIPTIVNANDAISELPPDCAWLLSDEFEDKDLIQALEYLRVNDDQRNSLNKRAREYISTYHNPELIAKRYAQSLEKFFSKSKDVTQSLIHSISKNTGEPPSDSEYKNLAEAIALTLPTHHSKKQLFIDVTATRLDDLKTGIQRVVRAIVWELIQSPPEDFRIEPVYITDTGGRWHYRYAREWTSSSLDIPFDWISDEPIEFQAGDILLVADYTAGYIVQGELSGLYKQLKNYGILIQFLIYDLLPIKMPEVFPNGVFGQLGYSMWLNSVIRIADSAICISRSVADELKAHIDVSLPERLIPMNIEWFHLGADFRSSIPTFGLPTGSEKTLAHLKMSPTFLMVSTIEPRKGHIQTLNAFTLLWKEGYDVNLVIVGKEGWTSLPEDVRTPIEKIMTQLQSHPELNKHLFLLKGISDEYLEKIYAVSTCLIAASLGEGFGLPLIEAAHHNLPIIARDIPIFREVTKGHAYYFSGLDAKSLADCVREWLKLKSKNQVPESTNMPMLTWTESVNQLKQIIKKQIR